MPETLTPATLEARLLLALLEHPDLAALRLGSREFHAAARTACAPLGLTITRGDVRRGRDWLVKHAPHHLEARA